MFVFIISVKGLCNFLNNQQNYTVCKVGKYVFLKITAIYRCFVNFHHIGEGIEVSVLISIKLLTFNYVSSLL